MATSDYVGTTVDELHERIGSAHERFAAIGAAADADLSVGGWTVQQVVAHLLNVVNRYNEFDPGRLAADPRGVDEVNRRELEQLGGRGVDELIGLLGQEMAVFAEMWGPQGALPLDAPIPFHGGATIDVQSGLTNLLAEYLFHGFDIARAAGTAWRIEDRDASLICGFASQILPHYVRSTNERDLLVLVDVADVDTWLLEVKGGEASARRSDGDVDADIVLSGRAVGVPLMFYGRLDPVDLDAAGTQVGGRHPELATILPQLFEEP